MTINSKHFYSRAGFGIPLHSEPQQSVAALFNAHGAVKPIDVVHKGEPAANPASTDAEMMKQKAKRNRSDFITLNIAWFNQLTDPEAVLREKMTYFWHDHFACRSRNALLAQQNINTIRQHAFGKFSSLLMAVSKDPAMLQFLNNQQNKKDSPNENFAREVMELFTLGRGNYSEDDIKNAARAFTGWTFNPVTGDFVVQPKQHDTGLKTFRGKSGNLTGEDVIHLILEDRQTATFITGKIVSFFVGTVNPELLNSLAHDFYTSGYDITKLMISLYSNEWFNDKKYTGNRIKSPVELLAGIQTHTGGTFNNALNVIFLQKALGQVLGQPPNVSGWASGTEWIDSSSLTFRMSLPAILLNSIDSSFDAKDDGDVNNDANRANKSRKISFNINMELLAQAFVKDSASATLDAVAEHLLTCPVTARSKKLVSAQVESSRQDLEFVKKAFIGFMSLPEYQLS